MVKYLDNFLEELIKYRNNRIKDSPNPDIEDDLMSIMYYVILAFKSIQTKNIENASIYLAHAQQHIDYAGPQIMKELNPEFDIGNIFNKGTTYLN